MATALPKSTPSAAAIKIDPAASGTKAAAIDSQVAALQAILRIEDAIRAVQASEDLSLLAVNDIRRMAQGRQAFFLLRHADGWETIAVSSLAKVDRTAHAIVWIESLAKKLAANADPEIAQDFVLSAYVEDAAPETAAYPFPYMLWQPLHARGAPCFAAFLQARETPWAVSDKALCNRLCHTLAHAWGALNAPGPIQRAHIGARARRSLAMGLALLIASALAFIHVPMTALAPAEIVAIAPSVVSVHIDGVIDDVKVESGVAVRRGDTLVKLVDTNEKGALEVAEREVAVAEANWRRFSQVAFADPQARRELGSAEADLRLKRAERDFATKRLEQTRIMADRDGVAVYADKRDLIGRPVQVGQRLMEISDPEQTQIRIQMPVEDSLLITPGMRARVFLDSDPLRPLEAEVVRAAMMARPSDTNTLAFPIHARLLPESGAPPRLGTRGTAQLAGESVSLAFYLFRRPITTLRQKFGI